MREAGDISLRESCLENKHVEKKISGFLHLQSPKSLYISFFSIFFLSK